MFKKFSPSTDIASNALIKSSVQRGIRTTLLSQMPALAADDGALLEYIWPKKEGITTLMGLTFPPSSYSTSASRPLLSVKRLTEAAHLVPHLLPHVQIDRGAIPYLLGGAHMMVPGFTSKGGRLPEKDAELPAGAPVAIQSEGKEHTIGVGILKLGTEEIKKLNKGTAVEVAAYIGDGLWAVDKL
ncbi:translation machinery-associated protein 20 [Ceratobasidium sp. 414]|nr:translation machinery-associated protein 20 [Ceratobasidium sp. 414]